MRSEPLLLLIVSVLLTFKVEITNAADRMISYEEISKFIKERNENVQAAKAILSAQRERTGYLARSFLPQVSGSLGTEEFKTDSDLSERKNYWKLKGHVNLYRGGRDKLENAIRKSNEKRAHAEYAVEINHALKEARESYWRLIETSLLIADRKEALARNESYLNSSKKRAGAGVATSADALQFELHRTILNQELKKLILEEDLLKNRLAVAIGFDDHKNLRVVSEFPHPPEEIQIPDQDSNDNIEVQRLKAIETTEGLRRSQASRWWLPTLDVYSVYGVPQLSEDYAQATRQDHEWTLGIVLTLDLGEGFEGHYEGNAKNYETLAAQKRAAHRSRKVQAIDHELRHDLKLFHELIHDADKDVDKSETFLKLTQSEYSRGVKNGPDLLEAFKQLYEFRERRINLYREYYISQTELLALTERD